jgi:anti-sigma B factor antagonist
MLPQPPHRRLDLEDIGDVTVASFTDHYLLDAQKVQAIGDQLADLVDRTGRRKLVLNFRNVQDISSLTLGMLVTLDKKIRAAGGKLVLCRVDPQIHEVMALTQLDKMFLIHDEEADALQAF